MKLLHTRTALDRRQAPRPTLLAAALLTGGLLSLPAAAAPEGGTVRAGNATIAQTGAQTRIDQSSDRAIIDWRSFSIGAAEQVLFVQPTARSATLNRVTGEQVSSLQGRMEANGQVFLVNPNGIVIGAGAQLNVGGLVASTANIANADFMAGRLEFRQPGQPGAAIVNQGRITAAEGGLVALVAPHVRNDGLIQARLGRVALGAGETFALDLYGDGLIRLAVEAPQAGRSAAAGELLDAQGQPLVAPPAGVQHGGRIEADGGQVVLISAAAARSALDQVINLSGTVRADAVQQQGGRIVLVAHSGTAAVSGELSAQGGGAGQSGGQIDVRGEQVRIAGSAQLDASGSAGGGRIHLGGGWQGGAGALADAPRAATTTVEQGARIAADARQQGRGGEVVLWADGDTRYAGRISARGGAAGGDGGQVEVSGRQTLAFEGEVDAGAVQGAAGRLLLDPAVMTIGLAEASLINRVLRTGTSTTVSADLDIHVNAVIDGRGRAGGGGLTLSAGRDINVNEYIVTANGAVRLDANTGTVRIASGRGVFAGDAPITVRTGGDLVAGPLITSGTLSLTSTGGHIDLDTPIDAGQGAVIVNAARDVRINQPVVNGRNGSAFSVTAGGDVRVNAQIDGRGGAAGSASGAVELTAGGDVRVNESVLTQLAGIRVRAIVGSVITPVDRGLFADGGTIDLSAGADLTTGILSTRGAINLSSTAGAVTLGHGLDATVGAVHIQAATDVHLDTPVLNARSGAALTVNAGRDLFVRAPIDGRGGAAGGAVTLTAGRNVALQEFIATNGGAVNLTATAGTVTQAPTAQVRSGNAPIAVSAGTDLTSASYVTGGALTLRSTGGGVTLGESIYDSIGATTISAAADVVVPAGVRVENVRTGAALEVSAGRDIIVHGQVGQDRNATTATGPITLAAGRNLLVNNDVVTRDAPLTLSAATGTVAVAAQVPGQPGVRPQVRAGNGTLSVTAGADLVVGDPTSPRPNAETPYITTGALNLSSTAGTLFIEAPIPDSTGRITLNGGQAVHVNERIYSNGQDITITAGAGGIVMSTASIDVLDPTRGITFPVVQSDIDAGAGNLTLSARGNINAPSVRSAGTLSITSTEGRIVAGHIYNSRRSVDVSLGFPQRVVLAGALGIDSFNTESSPDVEARSAQGSVLLNVGAPQRLYIQAAGDVRTGGFIGNQVELVAGNDVLLPGVGTAGLVRVNAGRDFQLGSAALIDALSAQAGRDIRFGDAAPPPLTAQVWIEGAGGTLTLRDPAAAGTVATLRGLQLTAGRDVVLPQPTHVSDRFRASGGVEANPQPTVISAGRDIAIGRLQTIGDVSLSAAGGHITLSEPLGAPLAPAAGAWNPTGLGVLSFTANAPASGAVISLQGVRAEGNVSVAAPAGSVLSAYALSSAGGSVQVVAPVQSLSATPIPPAQRLQAPPIVSPPIAPGPLRAEPAAPLIPAAPAPGAPALPEVLVAAPGAIDAGALAPPGATGGDGGEAAAAQAAAAARAAQAGAGREGSDGGEGTAASTEPDGGAGRPVLIYSGGRGVAQSVDLGRSGSYGSTRAPSADEAEEARKRRNAGKK